MLDTIGVNSQSAIIFLFTHSFFFKLLPIKTCVMLRSNFQPIYGIFPFHCCLGFIELSGTRKDTTTTANTHNTNNTTESNKVDTNNASKKDQSGFGVSGRFGTGNWFGASVKNLTGESLYDNICNCSVYMFVLCLWLRVYSCFTHNLLKNAQEIY